MASQPASPRLPASPRKSVSASLSKSATASLSKAQPASLSKAKTDSLSSKAHRRKSVLYLKEVAGLKAKDIAEYETDSEEEEALDQMSPDEATEKMRRFVLMRRVMQFSRTLYQGYRAKGRRGKRGRLKACFTAVHRASRTMYALNSALMGWCQEMRMKRRREERERDLLEQEWAQIQSWLEQVVDVVGGQSQQSEDPEVDHRQSRFRNQGRSDVRASKTDMKHTVRDLLHHISDDQSVLYEKSKDLVNSCGSLEKELVDLLASSQQAINEGEALKQNINKTTNCVQGALKEFLTKVDTIKAILAKQKTADNENEQEKENEKEKDQEKDKEKEKAPPEKELQTDAPTAEAEEAADEVYRKIVEKAERAKLSAILDDVSTSISSSMLVSTGRRAHKKRTRRKTKFAIDHRRSSRLSVSLSREDVSILSLTTSEISMSSDEQPEFASEASETPAAITMESLPENKEKVPSEVSSDHDALPECPPDEEPAEPPRAGTPFEMKLERKLIEVEPPKPRPWRPMRRIERAGEDASLSAGILHMQFRTSPLVSTKPNLKVPSLISSRVQSRAPSVVSRGQETPVQVGTYMSTCRRRKLEMNKFEVLPMLKGSQSPSELQMALDSRLTFLKSSEMKRDHAALERRLPAPLKSDMQVPQIYAIHSARCLTFMP